MSTESTEPVEPAPAKKNYIKFVVAGLLAVALIGGGIFAFNAFSGVGAAKVGDCASAKEAGDNKWEVKMLSCDDPKAAHKIAKFVASADEPCPEDGIYEPITADSKSMCLMPNFVEGACYTPSDDAVSFIKGDCKGETVVKVTKKIDGNPETVECPENSGEVRFSEPAVVYCLGVGENP